jgi:hypothetical protein
MKYRDIEKGEEYEVGDQVYVGRWENISGKIIGRTHGTVFVDDPKCRRPIKEIEEPQKLRVSKFQFINR